MGEMVSLSGLVDAVKYETVGMGVGVAAGGMTELVANELCTALNIHQSTRAKPAELLAEMLVRGACGAVGYVLTERLLRMINRNRTDPTDGAYFTFAYAAAQDRLYHVTVELGAYISSGQAFGLGSSGACCTNCEHGGVPCAGGGK